MCGDKYANIQKFLIDLNAKMAQTGFNWFIIFCSMQYVNKNIHKLGDFLQHFLTITFLLYTATFAEDCMRWMAKNGPTLHTKYKIQDGRGTWIEIKKVKFIEPFFFRNV